MDVKRDDLLIKLGQAKSDSPAGWRLVEVSPKGKLTCCLRKKKLREARRREGRYLLRSNLCDKDPAVLWQFYMLLTQIEEAFRNLKGDLSARLIYHQLSRKLDFPGVFPEFQPCQAASQRFVEAELPRCGRACWISAGPAGGRCWSPCR